MTHHAWWGIVNVLSYFFPGPKMLFGDDVVRQLVPTTKKGYDLIDYKWIVHSKYIIFDASTFRLSI